jgi:hypothetical protein
VRQSRVFDTWTITTGFSDLYYLPICFAFTTEAYMPDSARWISESMRSESGLPAISERLPWLAVNLPIKTSYRCLVEPGERIKIMPEGDPLFCFTSNTVEIHPCLNCHAPMTLISGNSSQSNPHIRTFQCFNCDSVDRRSLLRSRRSV